MLFFDFALGVPELFKLTELIFNVNNDLLILSVEIQIANFFILFPFADGIGINLEFFWDYLLQFVVPKDKVIGGVNFTHIVSLKGWQDKSTEISRFFNHNVASLKGKNINNISKFWVTSYHQLWMPK